MRVLFLDDDDRRHKEFKRAAVGAVIDHAFNAREAISLLRENAYDRVYLDHDLDDDPAVRAMDDYESGLVVADWLAENAAGRMTSRTAAIRLAGNRRIDKELDAIGIIAKARGHKGLAEEQPAA